jgi:phosphoribosylaminoimidazole-succinocarboxamide synthase
MSQADWDRASAAALSLFEYGQQEAAKRGLLLVDTKYELGKDIDGNILLLDEVRHFVAVSMWWWGGRGAAAAAHGFVVSMHWARMLSKVYILLLYVGVFLGDQWWQ